MRMKVKCLRVRGEFSKKVSQLLRILGTKGPDPKRLVHSPHHSLSSVDTEDIECTGANIPVAGSPRPA